MQNCENIFNDLLFFSIQRKTNLMSSFIFTVTGLLSASLVVELHSGHVIVLKMLPIPIIISEFSIDQGLDIS